MFLVVDVNVIFSAILNRGDSWKVFVENSEKEIFNLIIPEFLIIEIGKHTIEMAQRTNLSLQEAEEALTFIAKRLTFVSEAEYADKIIKARIILKGHQKDVPYLALALKFNCNIFSGDKVFKQLCPEKVKNPKEILQELFK